MLSVKVEDYGETEDQMHYVTYRASGLSEKELDFLLNVICSLIYSIPENSSHSLQMMHILNLKIS